MSYVDYIRISILRFEVVAHGTYSKPGGQGNLVFSPALYLQTSVDSNLWMLQTGILKSVQISLYVLVFKEIRELI